MNSNVQSDYLDLPCENCSDSIIINSSVSFGPFRCGIPPFLPPDIPPLVDYLQATIVMVLLILSLVLNSFVIFLVARYRVLQHRGFFLALQLVVSNLVSNSIIRVIIFTNALARGWLYGNVMCELFGMLHDGLTAARFLLMLVLALDRVFTVFLPFYYAKHGNKISTAMSITAWSVSFIRVLVPLRGAMDCYAYLPTFKTCLAVSCSTPCRAYTLSMVAGFFTLGGVVPFLLYIILCCKAKKLKRRILPALELTPRGTSDISRAQQNRQTMVTFIVLSIALVGSVLPPFILYMIQFAFLGKPPSALLILQILLGRTFFYALSVADPIVIMRNRDVKDVIVRLKATISQKMNRHSFSRSNKISRISTLIDPNTEQPVMH